MPDQPLNPDALANLIAWEKLPFGGRPDSYISLDANAAHAVIEILKPHLAHAQPVVNREEELDKLPYGSLILDNMEEVGKVRKDTVYFADSGEAHSKAVVAELFLPATVIYTPEGGTE